MSSKSKGGTNILSVDMGTSSVRACLVSPKLKIMHQSSRNLQLITDAKGKAEMDAEKIIQKTLTCIRETFKWAETQGIPVSAISFSSASAGLVCLDAEFKPLRPLLTYADMRATKESQWLIETYGRKAFAHTAAPVHASYWLPKLLWLKHQGLLHFESLRFCTIKDLLIYRLTGKFVIDAANAAAVGMLDARKIIWDERSLEIAGIKAAQLPQILPTTTVLESQKSFLDRSSGEKHTPKIVLGAMDGVLACLGVGAYRPGQMTTSLGSSGACRIATPSPQIAQADHRIWSYPLTEDLWISGGAMNNGGLVTEWLVENFSTSRESTEEAFTEMLLAASKIKPGADGLLFLPYLFGERAPIYNEQARGVYFGLHNRHHRGHFARAGLEGILFALYSIYDILQASSGKVIEIRAAGGYLQSDLMLQIQADIFGQPILIPSEHEGSVIGAAALAQKAMGIIPGFDALDEHFTIQKEFKPDHAAHSIYQDCFARYKKLYECLSPVF